MAVVTDQDLRRRLAELIVEALEVGSGKHERDVIDEIFDSFGINFNDLAAPFPQSMPGRTKNLRKRAAGRLAEAAPTAAALLNEVMRCGGRFVAMVDEVYRRLSRHASTEAGTSETFRLQRARVDEGHLTISEAFIEQVRRLMRSVRTVEIGKVNEAAIGSFIGWDGGELYGRWPVDAKVGDRLADAVLNLAWITPAVGRRASLDAAWTRASPAVDAARASAERLAVAAERLVRAHVAHLDVLPDIDAEAAARLLFSDEPTQWRQRNIAVELERFRAERVLAHIVPSASVTGIDEMSAVGLGGDLGPVVLPATDYRLGTGVSSLAGFVAMWRLGLWSARSRPRIEDLLLADPAALMSWLDWVTTSCDQAAAWLTNDVFVVTSSVDVTELLESIEEFLNLPLWRQRHLLYEVWVLCATLDACEQTDWVVKLRGLTRTNGIWALSVGPAEDPVATLRYRADPAISLDVWREPNRATSTGVLTPDITVSTPGPYLRDLLVVEAKDRHKMSLGRSRTQDSASPSAPELRTALGVAHRYAAGLHPLVTWVCNHCNFRQDTSAAANHGDVWTRVHVAAEFRPGNVPAAFTDSVRVALALPPGMHSDDDSATSTESGLVLVIDVTTSMSKFLTQAFAMLIQEPAWASFGEFRAVLYSDHGDDEPFLVRKVGPFSDLPSLIDAVTAMPPGNGHDVDEALEDAVQRCRELTDDIGPQLLLVLTDAPPHTAGNCPYGIDFEAEVRLLLKSGCRLQVANDWLQPNDETWTTFQDMARFHLAPLSEIIALQASAPDRDG